MNITKKYEGKYPILSDKKYLERLAKHIDDNNYLDTDEIYLKHDRLTNDDILNLFSLFDELSYYAMDIYVYPKSKEFDTYYLVKINDKFYQIGCVSGQGGFTYITKPEYDINEEDAVDITDLSKINYRAMEIENALQEISNFIDDKRKNVNIPARAILNMAREYVIKI